MKLPLLSPFNDPAMLANLLIWYDI
jgi:hypothetical protein